MAQITGLDYKIQEMAAVKGVGLKTAKKLFENGIRSLAHLREAIAGREVGDKIPGAIEPITITAAMKAGVEFNPHVDSTRMPMKKALQPKP